MCVFFLRVETATVDMVSTCWINLERTHTHGHHAGSRHY